RCSGCRSPRRPVSSKASRSAQTSGFSPSCAFPVTGCSPPPRRSGRRNRRTSGPGRTIHTRAFKRTRRELYRKLVVDRGGPGGPTTMEKLHLDLDGADPRRGLGSMARGLIGSEILKIASEIRNVQMSGRKIANFTVGDFSSKEFPIPDKLREGTLRALSAGEANYPPPDGIPRPRR